MPYLLIHVPTGRIVATVDRNDITSWFSLVELPVTDVQDYRTEQIPSMTTLPKWKVSHPSPDVEQIDRPTPLPLMKNR